MPLNGKSCPECEKEGKKRTKGYTDNGLMQHLAQEHIGNMQLITVHFPQKMMDELDRRVENNEAPNRSELVRYAVNEYFRKNFSLREITQNEIIENRIRLGKKRWKVGSVHWCVHKLYQSEPDCLIKILAVHQEKLSMITIEGVHREGFDCSIQEFIEGFKQINAKKNMDNDPLVWVVEFELYYPVKSLKQLTLEMAS